MHAELLPSETRQNFTKQVSKVEHYKWQILDAEPTAAKLPKTALLVDLEYQRDLVDSKTREMARAWSWIACMALVVAKRDGQYFVVDGQHRLAAAMRRSDITELPCLIFESEGLKQEAQAFLRANTLRKPLASVDRHRALVIVGDGPAIMAQDLIDQAGRRVHRQTSKGTIECVASIRRCCEVWPEATKTIWPLLIEVCRGHGFDGKIVQALAHLEAEMMKRRLSLTRNPYRDRLKSKSAPELVKACNEAALFYKKGGYKVWSEGVARLLDRGVRSHRILTNSDD